MKRLPKNKPMNLQPSKTHILVRLYDPAKQVIETISKTFDGDARRTRVEVLAIGPDVKSCKVGDFLLLIPKPILLPAVNQAGDEVLVDDGHVLGVVLDDKAPLTIVE